VKEELSWPVEGANIVCKVDDQRRRLFHHNFQLLPLVLFWNINLLASQHSGRYLQTYSSNPHHVELLLSIMVIVNEFVSHLNCARNRPLENHGFESRNHLLLRSRHYLIAFQAVDSGSLSALRSGSNCSCEMHMCLLHRGQKKAQDF
jgi:hypothetical protein